MSKVLWVIVAAITIATFVLGRCPAYAALTYGRESLKGTARTTGDFNTKPKTACFTCSLSKESQTFVAHGGSDSFSVKPGNAGTGIAIPDVDWITTNVIVQFSVKPNSTSSDREGHITVGDKVFTVNQSSAVEPIGNRPSTGQSSTKAKYQ